MKTIEALTDRLSSLKSTVHDRFAVSQMEIFGSYVRGEQREQSDLDILVEFDRVIDLLDLVSLELFLTEQLGVKTDVIPKRSIRPELREAILNEAVLI